MSIRNAGNTDIVRADPYTLALLNRENIGDDLPAGYYTFNHRAKPIFTNNSGNTNLVINWFGRDRREFDGDGWLRTVAVAQSASRGGRYSERRLINYAYRISAPPLMRYINSIKGRIHVSERS